MSDQNRTLEITRDIIIKMLDEKLISPTANANLEARNQSYITEVCKAFKTVYQTVDSLTKCD